MQGVVLRDLPWAQGLDDFWQACGTGVNGSFHSVNGTPLINLTRFPDSKSSSAAVCCCSSRTTAARATVTRAQLESGGVS